MIRLVRPKYFTPIYWDIYFRELHAQTAMEQWIKRERILSLENWDIVDFTPEQRVFRSKIKVPLQEIIIDWNSMWTATSHVLTARAKMRDSWVVVLNYKVDKKTRAILWHIRLESRGLVYLDEVRSAHRDILKKARNIYENTIKDIPDIEEKELIKIIKTDLEKYIVYRLDREPMIIPIITEI